MKPILSLVVAALALTYATVAFANPDGHSQFPQHSAGGRTCPNYGYSLINGSFLSAISSTISSSCSNIYAEVYAAALLCAGGWIDEYSGWVVGGFAGETNYAPSTICVETGQHRISITGVDVSAMVVTDTSHPVH